MNKVSCHQAKMPFPICVNCQCLAWGREQLGAHLLPMGRQLNNNLGATHSISTKQKTKTPAQGVLSHL